jgi:hypothetical protein
MANETYSWNDATAWNWANNASSNVKLSSGTAGSNGNGWQAAGDLVGGILGGLFGNNQQGTYNQNTGGVYQNPNLNNQGSGNMMTLLVIGFLALMLFRK